MTFVSGPFGPTYSANLLIMLLVLLFLTVPVILILIDTQRNKKAKARKNPEEVIAEALAHGDVRKRQVVLAERTLEIVSVDQVRNNFLNDKPPEIMGYIPPLEHVAGPIRHRGYLQIGPNAIVEGNVHVAGSLALGTGAEIYGDVEVTGELYLAPSANITGRAQALGDVYLDRWSELGDLETPGQLHVGRGAQVLRSVEAERVTYDLVEGMNAEQMERVRAREPEEPRATSPARVAVPAAETRSTR